MRTLLLTSCLAILVFSAFAGARLRNLAADNTPTPSTADVKTFLSGVWEAIGLGHDFDDFAKCLPEDKNAGAQLQKAMTLMNSSSALDVSRGLNKLDRVVTNLLDGLKACQMKDKYTVTIKRIIDTFTSSDNLTVELGSSLQIDGIEVSSDVSDAIIACDAGNYDDCGSSLGAAMGKAFYSQQNVTSAVQAAKINATPNLTWTAGDVSAFKGMNLWQFKKDRVNLRRKKEELTTDDVIAVDETKRGLQALPVSFDTRTRWPGCIQPIRDQQGCGSCWAFAASEVLGDRFCIATNKTVSKVMSPQFLVSCDTKQAACNGGFLIGAWTFLENSGDVTDACWPYKSGNGFVPTCSSFTRCADGSPIRKYYAKKNSTKLYSNTTLIQMEILANGPVEAGMDVYSDFMYYRNGIYASTAGATFLGGHAVKIVGWGNANGSNYWIIANSWGTYWGESGYFRIKFGNSAIDKNVIFGTPDLTRS